MSSAETFYFEDIFGSYDEWLEFIQANTEVIDFGNAQEAAFDLYCYNLLSRHYNHCNIRYSTPMAFMGELLNVYENKFKQFMIEKTLIDTIYNLQPKDYELISSMLTNMANNPNDDVENPLEPLNYISAQTYNQTTDNKFKAYFQALNNMPTLNTYKFFKAQNKEEMGFDDLFMSVQPNQKYMFKRKV